MRSKKLLDDLYFDADQCPTGGTREFRSALSNVREYVRENTRALLLKVEWCSDEGYGDPACIDISFDTSVAVEVRAEDQHLFPKGKVFFSNATFHVYVNPFVDDLEVELNNAIAKIDAAYAVASFTTMRD